MSLIGIQLNFRIRKLERKKRIINDFQQINTTPTCTHNEYDHNNNETETFRNRKMRPFGRNANSLLPNICAIEMSTVNFAFLAFPFSFQSPLPAPTHTYSEIVWVWNDMCYVPPTTIAAHCVYVFGGEAVIARLHEKEFEKKRRTKIDSRRMHAQTQWGCVSSVVVRRYFVPGYRS